MAHIHTALFLTALMSIGLVAQNPKSIPDYSQTPRAQVPESVKFNTADLFPSETAWRTEFEDLKKLAGTIDSMINGWTDSPKAMADLLERMSDIRKHATRVFAYASLQGDMDMGDSHFQKMKGEVQNFMVGYRTKQAFIEPDVLKLGQEKIDAYVKAEPRLAAYRFDLEKIQRGKQHVMAENEQRIASMTGLFSGTPNKAFEMLNTVDMPMPEITFQDGNKVLLNQANFQKYRSSNNVEDRRKAMDAYWRNQKQFENTLAALYDGSVKANLFNAKIHKFDTCLDAALFETAIDPSVYTNLISTVRAHLDPLHRLLKLRQKMLGLPEFRYGDIYASAVDSVNRTYTFEEAKKLVLDAMAPLGDEYGKAIRRAFDERWIDIYANKGKQSGAYSSGVYGVHPYVKLNYDGSYREVSTLAHELGHSMHSFFSNKNQPYPMSQYPTFLAEIASTFNENMLMNLMLKTEKDDHLKLYLLDRYLEGMRQTLYRQTLFADFELTAHERAEQGLPLTSDWLNAKYLELTRLYYGHDKGIITVEDSIQSEWSAIPHFYRDFYVYQYVTGTVASMALVDAVQKDGEPARKRYLESFLSAGGSDYPLNTLKKVGVDMSTPKPIEAALTTFDHLVSEMEAIQARLEKPKK